MKNETIDLKKMSNLLGNHKNSYDTYSVTEIEAEIKDYTNLKKRAIRENDDISLAEIEEELAELKRVRFL